MTIGKKGARHKLGLGGVGESEGEKPILLSVSRNGPLQRGTWRKG